MVVQSIHFDEAWQATPVIDENVVMTNLHLLVPGSAEEINRRKTSKGSHADYPISVLKPWPGSWKEVVVDNLSN